MERSAVDAIEDTKAMLSNDGRVAAMIRAIDEAEEAARERLNALSVPTPHLKPFEVQSSRLSQPQILSGEKNLPDGNSGGRQDASQKWNDNGSSIDSVRHSPRSGSTTSVEKFDGARNFTRSNAGLDADNIESEEDLQGDLHDAITLHELIALNRCIDCVLSRASDGAFGTCRIHQTPGRDKESSGDDDQTQMELDLQKLDLRRPSLMLSTQPRLYRRQDLPMHSLLDEKAARDFILIPSDRGSSSLERSSTANSRPNSSLSASGSDTQTARSDSQHPSTPHARQSLPAAAISSTQSRIPVPRGNWSHGKKSRASLPARLNHTMVPALQDSMVSREDAINVKSQGYGDGFDEQIIRKDYPSIKGSSISNLKRPTITPLTTFKSQHQNKPAPKAPSAEAVNLLAYTRQKSQLSPPPLDRLAQNSGLPIPSRLSPIAFSSDVQYEKENIDPETPSKQPLSCRPPLETKRSTPKISEPSKIPRISAVNVRVEVTSSQSPAAESMARRVAAKVVERLVWGSEAQGNGDDEDDKEEFVYR